MPDASGGARTRRISARREPTFGWVTVTDPSGAATLVPLAPACPGADGPIETGAIRTLGTLAALSCFGNRELEMQGLVRCSSAAIDSRVGGPFWLGANWECDIDGALGLHGSPVGV